MEMTSMVQTAICEHAMTVSQVVPGPTHEAGGELGVSSDLVVNLDESLGNDQGDFTPCQGVFETVSEEHLQTAKSEIRTIFRVKDEGKEGTHAQRKTLAQLVRTWVGSRSVSATKLVEHP
jgi:hypothetical protein